MTTLNLALVCFSLELVLLALALILGHRPLHQRLTPARATAPAHPSVAQAAARLCAVHESLMRQDRAIAARIAAGEDSTVLAEAAVGCRRTIMTVRKAAATLADQGAAAVPHCLEMLSGCEALAGTLGELVPDPPRA
ncbi:MAG TPA: hypothetical protein PLS90_07915 [Candidatus Sumerlaeota bacterium]|nr:MAG: hypothetical protein BWZ08_01225 [candidate division BRC1 bacterium ADurb.BinA292]HOE96884.1 hypothetical protein [Candidatus Sumerlaeota bacterium]HOR26912.1 hypothetical protein [Candidatus Sumerlaeota bacterium]HPK02370.1 hypothetical protein [Candidatus Sumerlaeota bacterium]